MNILVVAPQPFYAERGTPIATRQLVQTLSAQGHRVDLLAYPMGEDVPIAPARLLRSASLPGIDEVPVGPSWRKLALDVPLAWALARLARPGVYDVIHAVEEAVFLALALRPRHGARVVYDMDSSMSGQVLDQYRLLRPAAAMLQRLERWAISRADLVLPVCDDLGRLAGLHLEDSAHKVHILRDTPVPPAPTGHPVDDLRDGWPDGTTLVLYVGNLMPYQGIDLLVEAASRLDPADRIGIVVVGGREANLRRYRELTDERGLDDRIRFVGPRPLGDLSRYLAQADILVSPRTKGGNTPLKIYSYMAADGAIAATRLPTHTQVLDEDTARLFEPRADDLAETLRTLAGDPHTRRRLGAAATEQVERKYSAAAYETALRAAYASLDR